MLITQLKTVWSPSSEYYFFNKKAIIQFSPGTQSTTKKIEEFTLGRVRKFPWRREWQPTPVEFHGQKSLVWYSPWSHKELDTTEQLTLWTSQEVLVVKNLSDNARDVRDPVSNPGSGRPPGGGHGSPLQYCLKNPMDSWACGPQSRGSHKESHDWSNLAHMHRSCPRSEEQKICTHWMCWFWLLGYSTNLIKIQMNSESGQEACHNKDERRPGAAKYIFLNFILNARWQENSELASSLASVLDYDFFRIGQYSG